MQKTISKAIISTKTIISTKAIIKTNKNEWKLLSDKFYLINGLSLNLIKGERTKKIKITNLRTVKAIKIISIKLEFKWDKFIGH